MLVCHEVDYDRFYRNSTACKILDFDIYKSNIIYNNTIYNIKSKDFITFILYKNDSEKCGNNDLLMGPIMAFILHHSYLYYRGLDPIDAKSK